MADYAILLDLGRCIGCQACVASCKVGNELGEGQQYIQLVEKTHGEFPNLFAFANALCAMQPQTRRVSLPEPVPADEHGLPMCISYASPA